MPARAKMRSAFAAAVLIPCITGHLAPGRHGAFGFDDEALGDAGYFEQKVDHFTAGSTAYFAQAYYTNQEHFKAGGPVFLYIGGEGPLSSKSVTRNFIVDWLPKVGGLLYSLEHRYYGCHNVSSCPYDVHFNGTVNEQMQYLTTEQALADLAAFATAQKELYKLEGSPWVLIGGSYPGMLAAFGRARYPEVFACAVASSAPVHGILDYQAFEEVVSRGYAMNVEGVRGSPACAKAIDDGHVEVGELLKTAAGREKLAELFPKQVPRANWLEDPTNQRTFAGCGVASFPAQANHPGCAGGACGVTEICEIMASGNGTPLELLAKVAAAQYGGGADMTGTCEMDWEMPGDVPPARLNYWGWQCCTEYGFYQTCEEGTECFYTRGIVSLTNPDHAPDGYCQSQFGIARTDSQQKIIARDARWTPLVANASKILWVNGDLDPWHARSNLAPPAADQPVIWPVEGASHCAWMAPASEADQQSVQHARAAIYKQLSEWLGLRMG